MPRPRKHPLISKVCSDCGVDRPHNSYPNGNTYPRCLDCQSAYARARWQAMKDDPAKLEEKRTRDRDWNKTSARKAAHRRYRTSPRGQAAQRRYETSTAGRAVKLRHTHKQRARQAVSDAVTRGRLLKPPICSSCRKTFPMQLLEGHHHKGYDKAHWLDVVWLCPACSAPHHGDA